MIPLGDRYCSFSSLNGFLRIKQIAQRQWEKAGAEVLSIDLATTLQAALHKWALRSADRNPLSCMTLPSFKTLNYVSRPHAHSIHKNTWKQMSLCTLSLTHFGNLNFRNLFCTELETGSSFKMQFSSFFLSFCWLFGSEVCCWLVCSHSKTAEKSFQYVCRPCPNVLHHYLRFFR